jgi:hypothetical protein
MHTFTEMVLTFVSSVHSVSSLSTFHHSLSISSLLSSLHFCIVFGRSQVQLTVWTLAIQAELFCDFPHSSKQMVEQYIKMPSSFQVLSST